MTIRNIKKGEIFSSKNLWVKRPATGDFKASELKKLFGKKSTKNLINNVQLKKKMLFKKKLYLLWNKSRLWKN